MSKPFCYKLVWFVTDITQSRRSPCGKSAPVRWSSDASNRDAYSPAWVNTKSVILSSLRTFRICECESVEENYRILHEPNSIQIFHEGWAILRPLQLFVSKQMALPCELQKHRYWASFTCLELARSGVNHYGQWLGHRKGEFVPLSQG